MLRRVGRRTLLIIIAALTSVLVVAPGVAPAQSITPSRVCLPHPSVTSADYNALIGDGVGAWQAGDNPHFYPLPDGRTLWLLNDSFLNPTAPRGPITTRSTFVHNAAFVEDGRCLTLLSRPGAGGRPLPFVDHPLPDHWYWPLGGVVEGGRRLVVFMAEMAAPLPLTWALNVRAVGVVAAVFDVATLELMSIRPAPDSGATPAYGSAVVSDGEWTYLFANNIVYGQSTTATYVARVPAGRVLTAPYEYWTGASWSSRRDDARPVLDPGGYSYMLTVLRVGEPWMAVVKVDDFFGSDLHVLGAPSPVGPWTVDAAVRVPLKPAAGQNTYSAFAIARIIAGGRLVVGWSNNNFDYEPVAANPSLYRPTFAEVALPRRLLRHRLRAARVPEPDAVRFGW